MAFGIKTKNIKTQNSYTIESFFDAIKDKEFTAGTPSLTKHGMATVITFPALDSQNQVRLPLILMLCAVCCPRVKERVHMGYVH